MLSDGMAWFSESVPGMLQLPVETSARTYLAVCGANVVALPRQDISFRIRTLFVFLVRKWLVYIKCR